MADKVTLISRKDLKIEWFSPPGNGGQYRNRHHNSCRLKHEASGVTVQSTEHREAQQNLKAAFKRLCDHPDVKLWLARKVMEVRSGKTMEDRVD